ncbi:hypothetical protein ACP4OV_016583 [Aristida adscensionis]
MPRVRKILEVLQGQGVTPEGRVGAARILGLLSIFAASVIILGTAMSLANEHSTSAVCTHRVLVWPSVAIGLILMFVVLPLGCCGVWGEMDRVRCFFFLGLFFVMVALLVFVVFGYVAVGGMDLSPVKVREYDLRDYSGWLRGRVPDPRYWDTVAACLRGKHACEGMTQLVRDPDTGIFVPELSKYDRWAKRRGMGDWHILSPIESGCCKPPSSCAFTYVNGTTWMPAPGAPATTTDADCTRWSNDPQALCFQCDSCKAGLLDDIKKGWSAAAICSVVALTIKLVASCCLLLGCGRSAPGARMEA